jgi:hypothetical protein
MNQYALYGRRGRERTVEGVIGLSVNSTHNIEYMQMILLGHSMDRHGQVLLPRMHMVCPLYRGSHKY